MTIPRESTTETLGSPSVSDAQQAAATRAVLLRVEQGQLTAAEALQVLQALGVVPTELNPLVKYNPEGRRDLRRMRNAGR